MALPTFSFVAGLLVLVYLSTFVIFAVLRILTGISIQRIGWYGLRRISFTPKDGIRIDLRGLRLSLHRPTFAQPTYVSIVLEELKVSLDQKALNAAKPTRPPGAGLANGSSEKVEENGRLQGEKQPKANDGKKKRSETWQKLTEVKERIKKLHRQLDWIRMVDLVATTTSVVIKDVGSVQVAQFSAAVDTRRKMVDRTRLFQHRRAKAEDQSPAEWIFSVRNILFSPEGQESTEILDHLTLNIHGLLFKDLDGLRDASIALKLGRLNLPVDDIHNSLERMKRIQKTHSRNETVGVDSKYSFDDVMEELDNPGSREDDIVQTVSDSKEFVSSILRGIQEVQFAVSFFGLTKRIRAGNAKERPVFLNMSMKEVGFDLLRLDPRSPAHLMYFSPQDIAHQALLAAIAISVGIDHGQDHPERLLYIPMATTTVKTTLPAKTIQFDRDRNVAEKNTNILFANLVVTSPSLDLDPKHLPLIMALLQKPERRRPPPASRSPKNSELISRLLPKANVKISVHEPVIRVTLPPTEPEKKDTDEFDLLISSMSSISLDLESSHSAGGELHYSLGSHLRVASHQLYYQTASSVKHNLLLTDAAEAKLSLDASPHVSVVLALNFQTFSIYMLRPEISEGVRQIVTQLRSSESEFAGRSSPKSQSNFLRKLPKWLNHIEVQGSDFNAEIAGIDPDVSEHSRGIAVHLDSWRAEYKADKSEESAARLTRRRATSRNVPTESQILRAASPSSPTDTSVPTPRKRKVTETDGRRLAVHIQGLEGFVIESWDSREEESFLKLPRFEAAFTTSTDHQGPVFHINCHAKALFVNYSLYRHFAIGVALMVLQRALAKQHSDRVSGPAKEAKTSSHQAHLSVPELEDEASPLSPIKPEVVTFDLKVMFLQAKATMPEDPPLMLQLHGLEAGRHRWATPFVRAQLTRLYTEAPGLKKIWARMVTVKGLRLDLRKARRKTGTTVVEEKSIDVNTDAIRIAVPHQLTVHKVFDNITNTIKTVEQLHHRFQTQSNEYVLDKPPEAPKKVPKVSIRSQALLFEIEDSGFEWKLGTIYRLGLLEQKQRIAREEAFEAKVKKLSETDRRRPAGRAKSAHQPRGRSRQRRGTDSERRSQSLEREGRPGTSRERGRRMRYNPDGTCDLSDDARVHVEQAREKLNRLHAQSWKKRIDTGLKNQTNSIRDIRAAFWGVDDMPEEVGHKETILSIPQRPALAALLISDLSIVLDKPSFPLELYPEYIYRIGKGMPKDMKYSLLIPMNLQVSMGEARMNMRDYPLPLLHVPAIKTGQSMRLPSLTLKSDFIIAEEYRDSESSRMIEVEVVPPETLDTGEKTGGFAVNVRRTIAPVKMYSDMKVEVNTSQPTRITWGASYQPAVQDMMQVIEGFSKAAMDPSEKVGFWDKIRLSFHSEINVAWKGDGDVHLLLKGSRDPYKVTGDGAGFVMCWQNDVRLNVCQEDDPKKFITVDSGVCVLAVPELSHYARQVEQEESDTDSLASGSNNSLKQGTSFRKTVMKLSGNVRWLFGLVFERNEDDGRRSFEFSPHYNVILKHPDHAKPFEGQPHDAFRGFRSHHIHMSVGIAAPHDRDWSVANTKASTNYNSLHLTPRIFSHFYSWWSMFSGAMSLPVRQGALFPGVEKSSKKFGRHLATMKLGVLLSPLYLSHIYKHKDPDDYGQAVVSATGLKVRLDSFMLDLHMRREEFQFQPPGTKETTTTTGMRINQVQLDFMSADIRAVSASINGTDSVDLEEATEETLASYQQQDSPKVDLSKFTIPDNDLSWVDMDDFVELDWILPAEANPETKILPLAFAPRFTYFRQTDHQDHISGDPHRSSPFGNEPTHFCVMSKQNDPRRVQCELIAERLQIVRDNIEQNQRAIGEQQLRILRATEDVEELEDRLSVYKHHQNMLEKKYEILRKMYDGLERRLQSDDSSAVPGTEGGDEIYDENSELYDPTDKETQGLDSTPLADYISDFNNRFVIHNAQLKWNNGLRNIILRYIHQVSQRRGVVYYMSRRAVKFILDIVEEQNKVKDQAPLTPEPRSRAASTPMSPEGDDEMDINERIQQLLNDGKKFVNAEDPEQPATEGQQGSADKANEDIGQEFTAQNTYHLRLIAPQIQLQSEKNTKSAVLVTAKGMQLKVIQIMDKDRVTDDVSGLVQRRFSAAMDSLQIFFTSTQTFSTEYLHMYSGNRYGCTSGTAWPPWVPFEVMFEFDTNPYGFSRVVQRTSASMRYDKYNTLRLKYNDDVSGEENGAVNSPDSAESRVDHIWIEFPHVRVVCDSTQYYTMYIIVLDLLLYSEPLEKQRTEKLEKIMLASDFSNLNGIPELVVSLQERIRQLEEIKLRFQINEQYLDREGWKNRIELEKVLAENEEELFFMMKAITTSQRKTEDRAAEATQPTGLIRYYIAASDIVWHLVRETNKSLAEFQLGNASFDRTDNSDGSNVNSLEIESIRGLNLLSDAVYPEMISPYFGEASRNFGEGRDTKMLRVHWYMLEAIAGIPVMDHFEVNLFPLKVQLELEIGKKLFEYAFPESDSNEFENANFSPFMMKQMMPPGEDEDNEIEEFVSQQMSPEARSRHSMERRSIDGSGPGALELRLQPTLTLADTMAEEKRPKSSSALSTSALSRRPTGLMGGSGSQMELPQLKMFGPDSRAGTSFFKSFHSKDKDKDKDNSDALTIASRPSSRRSSATRLTGDDKPRRFGRHRDPSASRHKKSQSDDLNQMMSRASNYMTFAYIKIPSMVLCLSYKGKGQRNFEDVHDLVFRMPTMEYRNKTWSNLDLALALKKDVIRALISHAGTIINNKFSHHRPHKQAGSRLKQIANPSILLNTSESSDGATISSSRDRSPGDYAESYYSEPRRSFASGRDSQASHPESYTSSPHSTTGKGLLVEEPSFADELSQVDIDRESIRQPNSLHRAITAMSYRSRDREPELDDPEESNRMKSKLLLGKKFVKSLGHK
ncbi:uncharacterized protein K452DRAFT_319470 [Aplosporella prunicola CBS 121167]|uniref:FMP27 GFWDK domain-containing protein n=1 Tax=Aplosporella prunicola CBS 121167 TaxID=1176127 RepID=A0A6A6BAD6_9PEZI|nr:uncharacterized protein K452DRAFT_319470 [Aplosporella prunicola CBS 121167]KAF2140548.1 hypothetical protein K452DRAFT_319470 [Aplosporella prunicola CBS 121167]